MAENSIIVVTEEFLKRVFVGLGEIPSKFAHAVIMDFEAQLNLAKTDVRAYVSLIEEHLMPHKAKVALQDAEAAAAAAEQKLAAVEKIADALIDAGKEVAADVKAA